MKFHKYQGTGNDFIMIDNRDNSFSEAQKKDEDFIEKLCHRRFGIGADGLILIENSKQNPKADFEMVYFNADGNLGSMCGNGGRCAVAFAYRLNAFQSEETTFLAFDGLHKAKVTEVENEVSTVELQMGEVYEVENNSKQNNSFYFLDTGSPHYVRFLRDENLENYEVVKKGKNIRYNDRFREQGTNVNFVEANSEKSKKNSIFVRTYERGVEDETLSCGTGVTACAIAFYLENTSQEEQAASDSSLIDVKTLGGDLQVRFDVVGKNTFPSQYNFKNIFLIGIATAVFEGTF